MTFYLLFMGVVVLLLSLDWLRHRNGYGVLTLFALLLTILVVVMRHEVGYDYLNYTGMYLAGPSWLVENNIEWGFTGLVWALRSLGAGPYWMFFVLGLSIILLMFRGVKLYTPNVRIAMLIFLLIPGLFLNSLSIIRQSFAIVCVFNAFYYRMSGKYGAFYGFYALGALFHYSCLFVLPFFLIAPLLKNHARTIAMVMIPLSLVAARLDIVGYVFSGLLGGSKYSAYALFTDAGTSFVKLLVLNISVVPYLLLYKRLNDRNRTLLVVVVMGLSLFNMFSAIGAVTRVSYYFRIFEIVLLANIVSCFKLRSQTVICVCIALYYFIMFYSSLSFDYRQVDYYPKMTPYQTIFNKQN